MKVLPIVSTLAVLGAAFLAGCGSKPSVNSPDEQAELNQQVQAAIDDFKSRDESLGRFFTNAKAYAVFPEIVTGGAGVAGAHGDGEVFSGGQYIGTADVSQASIGLQLGGQKYAEIIFFENEGALVDFEHGTTEFDARATAVAAADGAARTADYTHGVLVFTMPKGGLMAQAAIGGQKFRFRAAGDYGHHDVTYEKTTTYDRPSTTVERSSTTVTNP